MADINIVIENLPELRLNLKNYPKITISWLNKAIHASVLQLQKDAVDSNFQFKTPRSKRTGYLQASFGLGISFGDLYGKIGPTAFYAPFVYFGTSRGIQPNPYMDRIAKASNSAIQKYFKDALDGIVKELAHV